MNLVHHGHDPKDDRNFRSHLGMLITRTVNKIVCLPVLKDHGSAGVTGRPEEHEPRLGQQRRPVAQHARHQRLQQVHPRGRQPPDPPQEVRPADHGRHQGGLPEGPVRRRTRSSSGSTTPSSSRTDPVAMDHVEWRIIDAKRKEKGLPPVAATGKAGLDPLGTEGFDVRQPQHIPLAGQPRPRRLRLQDRQTKPGQAVIDHRVRRRLTACAEVPREHRGCEARSLRRTGRRPGRDGAASFVAWAAAIRRLVRGRSGRRGRHRDHRALLDGDRSRATAGDAAVDGHGDLLGDADRDLARGGLGDHPAGRHGDDLGPLLGDIAAGGDRAVLDPLLGDQRQVRTS